MTTASENNSDGEADEIEEGDNPSGPSSSPSNEPCIYCPTGHFEPGTTTITLERKGTTLVVKQVPAQVCWACGEALLSEDTVDRLQDMMERTVEAEVETAVRPYTPENEPKTAATGESVS
jgi:YgiT-type zinc finger domain-containing protein